MQRFTKALALLSITAATAVSATSVSYDNGYDDASRSLTTVSCSDGTNGLITRYGWQTQGEIPDFPYIGGSSDIPGWNSDQCGNCYAVTWNGNTINVLAIDHAGDGLNVAQAALDKLTNGQAVQLGRVDAEVTKTTVDQCDLTASKRSVVFKA